MLARTVLILAVLPTAIFCQRPAAPAAAVADYDYADDPVTLAVTPKQTTIRLVAGSGAQAQQPAPVARQGAQGQLGPNEPKEVRPEPVQILQQINEHNEDGSYTYGYEGSDGSFKLETRFPDGRVQGRYGYVDIESGKLKVIEYGADFMGFQPVGDLPEGIVVPPPVFNNNTIEGEENFESGQFTENSRLTVQNRARQGPQHSLQGNPSQNRGQDFQQPPPPANREAPTRTPQLVVEQPFEEATPQQVQHFQAASFEPAGSRFEPTGAAPVRPVQHAAPQPQPALAAQFQAAPAQPAPERPRAQPAPQSFIQPLPEQGSSSFSQEVNFEGRPTAAQLQASSQSPFPSSAIPANAVPANAIPANAVPANPIPASAVPASASPANFQSSSEFRARPAQPAIEQSPQIQGVAPPSSRQPQGPFTSFPVNGGAPAPARPQSVPSFEQGGFEPINHPEAERSAASSFAPSEEQDNQQQEAPAAPQFNPNRARTNVRAQPANRPISAAPTRPVSRPAQPQPEQFAQPAQQAFPAQPSPPAQPAPQPARQLLQPVRQAPQPQAAAPTQASRQHLPRAQHITEGQQPQPQQQQQQQSFNNDNEDASTQPQPPSSGPPPKFASFPIVQEGARPRPQSQPAAFEQQVVRESFRPEEEPQPQPVRIRPRPQEAAPQQFEATPQLDQFQSFQAQSQQAQQFQGQAQQAQRFQAQAQQAQQQHFQAQPQEAQHFQAQPQPAQHFQAQPQQAQHFQAQPQFQQQQNVPSAINFDNLVQEFSAQNRAGRSREGFTTQTFKFNPVPAVPDQS